MAWALFRQHPSRRGRPRLPRSRDRPLQGSSGSAVLGCLERASSRTRFLFSRAPLLLLRGLGGEVSALASTPLQNVGFAQRALGPPLLELVAGAAAAAVRGGARYARLARVLV